MKPTDNFAARGYRPRVSSATSIPRFGLQLEANELELRVRVGHFRGREQLDVGKVNGQSEPTSELGHVVTIASEAFDFDDAVGFLKRGEPQALRIPPGIVDRGGIVLAQLGEHVGVDGRSVPGSEHARKLEQHGRRSTARVLQLVDRVLAGAQNLELRFDVGVIGERLFDLLDLARELRVRAHLPRELVALHLVEQKEKNDFENEYPEDDEEPSLVRIDGASRFAFLREQIDANQDRFSRSLRIDRPSATASWGPSVERAAGSTKAVSTAMRSSGEKTSTGVCARRSMACAKSGILADPPVKKMRAISASPLVAMKKSSDRWISAAMESLTPCITLTICGGGGPASGLAHL